MPNPVTADPDFRQPLWAEAVEFGLDYIRHNCRYLVLAALGDPPPLGSAFLPGWQTHVDISATGSYATPDKWVLTRGAMRIEIRFVWSGGALQSIQGCYDNGVAGGLVCFAAVTPTYEDVLPFSTTAKYLGNGDSPENYYFTGRSLSPENFGGLINANGSGDQWQKGTFVMSVYPLGDSVNTQLFMATSDTFRIAREPSGTMILLIEQQSGGFQSVIFDPADSPSVDAWPVDQWCNLMIAIDNDQSASPEQVHWDVWINGVEFHSGPPDNGIKALFQPNAWAGDIWCGHDEWDLQPGMECYASNLYAVEQYLDPNTYWSTFYDESNKPKDLGVMGEIPTGSQPDTYCPDFDLSNNLGFAGSWIEVGSVPNAPISPTD